VECDGGMESPFSRVVAACDGEIEYETAVMPREDDGTLEISR
jgi:hypothetical protein